MKHWNTVESCRLSTGQPQQEAQGVSGRGTGTPASLSSTYQLHPVLRTYFLSPSDGLGPSRTPSLDEGAVDTSEWDGEPVPTLQDSPWYGVCPTSMLWPVTNNISWIRPSQDLGEEKNEFCLEEQWSTKKGVQAEKERWGSWVNLRLPRRSVLVNICLGSCSSQWRSLGWGMPDRHPFSFRWLLPLLRQFSSVLCDFWLLLDGWN